MMMDKLYEGTRYSIEISDKEMYQLGKHYNKHGWPEMGYASKKEYQQAAYDFALEARQSPDAEILKGEWRSRTQELVREQIVIRYQGKSVILDAQTGQIMDFYVGTDNFGITNLFWWGE